MELIKLMDWYKGFGSVIDMSHEDIFKAIQRYYELENYDCQDEYEELLNDNNEDVELNGLYYPFGNVIRKVDYVRFREWYNDWIAYEQGALWDEYCFDDIIEWNPYDCSFEYLTIDEIEEYVKFRDGIDD